MHKRFFGMDVERLFILPIFFLLLIINVWAFILSLDIGGTIDIAFFIQLLHRVLVISFYLLLVSLYLLRRNAIATHPSPIAGVVAFIATFIPFIMPWLPKNTHPLQMSIIGDLLLLAGLAFSLYALSTLGRSFSILAESRNLVQSGPYRWVRHPLYLGELVSVLGMILPHISVFSFLAFLVLAVMQIYRTRNEEEVLSHSFPEYSSYRARTSRLIPGIF